MSESKTDAIVMKGNDSDASVAELHSRSFSSTERLSRAGKVLAIAWLLALITAFIPIAHFFLVPLFLIAGPVMAVLKYKLETALEKAHGVCPECSKPVDIMLEPTDKLPKRTYCPECNKPLQLLCPDEVDVS
jgi:hypothetical protein